jgi:hypothetical protein
MADIGAQVAAMRAAAAGMDAAAPDWAARTRREADLLEQEAERERHAAEYEVLGRDTTACCLAHKRKVRWLPAPAWWIHDDYRPHVPGIVYWEGRAWTLTDRRTCSGMWDAGAPIVTVRRATREVVYPDARETAHRAAQFQYREAAR